MLKGYKLKILEHRKKQYKSVTGNFYIVQHEDRDHCLINTCASALKSWHGPRTFLYLGTEGLGYQASPHLSLWTDGLLLWQLRSEEKAWVSGELVRRWCILGLAPPGPARPAQATARHGHMGRRRSGSLVLGAGVGGLLPGPVPGVRGDPGPAALHPPWASHYICKVREEGEGGGQEGGKVGLAKLIKTRTNFLSVPPLPSPGTPASAHGLAGRGKNIPQKAPAQLQG